MRNTRWALPLVLLAGCGNVSGNSLDPLPPSTLGPAEAGVPPAWRDAGRAPVRGIDGGGVPATVQVIILAPAGGSVLKAASSPEVRARVTSTMPVDASPLGDAIDSVAYSFIRADDENGRPLVTGPLFGPAANSEFATRTDLTTLETGIYILAVSAVTRNGGMGSATTMVQVDAGPTLRIVSPKSGGTYKGSVAVQVQIDAAPFGLAAETIEATVGGYPVALIPSAETPGLYEGLIAFDSYIPPLIDEQKLTVAASNSLGTRNEASVKFVVDVKGPVFSDTLPAPGAVVGGVILIRAKITDVSGILGPSVIAVIGDKITPSFILELEPEVGSPGYYSALFDTAKLTACKPAPNTDLCNVLPNLSFRASDTLGNDSYMAYDFAVDNHPPVFDLDPPPMRLIKYETKLRMNVCSWAFDPLGDYAGVGHMPGDNCVVAQAFDLRARIEDWGNRAEGLTVVPISGVDPVTTSMYVLDDTAQPLVVDMDGDGVCDGINPLLEPTTTPLTSSKQVLTVRLVPVPPTGSGDFTPDPALANPFIPSPGDPVVMANYPGCIAGIDPEAPSRLCGVQTIPIALGYPTALDPQAAVWTIEPLTDGEPWCLGGQFDTYANQIGPGWACFAAAGRDLNGNRGVSKPLHLWIDYRYIEDGFPASGPTCANPPPAAGPAPDCTGTYDPTTNQVSNKPCTARRFGSSELRWQTTPKAAGS